MLPFLSVLFLHDEGSISPSSFLFLRSDRLQTKQDASSIVEKYWKVFVYFTVYLTHPEIITEC